MAIGKMRPKLKRNKFVFLRTPVSVVFYVFLFSFFLIEDPLETLLPGINYFDEAIFILACSYVILTALDRKVNVGRTFSLVLLLICATVFIGLVGNYVNDYQKNYVAIVSEAIAYMKFPVTLIAFSLCARSIDHRYVVEGCAKVAKFFVIVCFLFCVVNLVHPFDNFSLDVRHGVISYKFIFSHPTFLVMSLVLAITMMEAQKQGISICKVLCLFTIAMTMRDKGFGFIVFALFLWSFKVGYKRNIFKYFLLAGSLIVVVSSPKIAEYISYSTSPRETLYATATRIALDSLPVGGGLASIASFLSGRYYSNAYRIFNIDQMDGLTSTNFLNTGDAGIPYYLGQFGFVGFVLTGLAFIIVFRTSLNNNKPGTSERNAILLLLGYVCIAVTVETVLTNGSGVMLAVVLVIIDRGSRCNSNTNDTGLTVGS